MIYEPYEVRWKAAGFSAHLPALESAEAHVWFARTAHDASSPADDLYTLAVDERERFSAIVDAQQRAAATLARRVVRWLLGHYLGMDPEQVPLVTGRLGKPMLKEPYGARLRFNVAHSEDLVMAALSVRAEVGVDVERIRPIPPDDLFSEIVWTAEEARELRSRPEGQRLEAFFTGWVRKEACLKALGLGLSQGMKQVRVSLNWRAPQPLEPTTAGPGATGNLSLSTVELGSEYAAALALAFS